MGTESETFSSLKRDFLDLFNNLKSEDENLRTISAINLIEYLNKSQSSANFSYELKYTLRRLVRGLGSFERSSLKGYYPVLVGLLTKFPKFASLSTIIPILTKELCPDKTIKKIDSSALVGQVFVCFALLRSEAIISSEDKEVTEVLNILLSIASNKKFYSEATLVLIIELSKLAGIDKFTHIIWPNIKPILTKPWENQTEDNILTLFTLKLEYPEILHSKYIKENFGGSQFLNSKSYDIILNFFWKNASIRILSHPNYKDFCRYLAGCKNLIVFWSKYVDPFLFKPSINKELITLKALTNITEFIDYQQCSVANLLTPNLIKTVVSTLNNSIRRDPARETYYKEFFEKLYIYCLKSVNTQENVNIILKFILHPGIINFEKNCPFRVIHKIISILSDQEIVVLFDYYAKIFTNVICKNPMDKNDVWLPFERKTAGHMLKSLLLHKNSQSSYEWRQQKLHWLMTMGLFYNNKDGEICTKESKMFDSFITEQAKELFYCCLQSKLYNLKMEKKVLFRLVEFCNNILESKRHNKYLINPIHEKHLRAWNAMFIKVKEPKCNNKSDKKLQLVFNILLLHMGLQLFREPETAEIAIFDLEKCIENFQTKNCDIISNGKEEPKWFDVIIDLFLHLLSQNKTALRSVINAVFPHICNILTFDSIYQILSVLDMKNGINPLTNVNEDINNEDENSEVNENSDDNNSDSDKSSSQEELINDSGDEGTEMDKLRNAVSEVLADVAPNDDQVSVDINDIDEDEAQRLQDALSNVFSSMKKPSENKRSKKYRIQTTSLMHFRIRILDLLEIYAQNTPPIINVVEIIFALLNMIEYCEDKSLEQLAIKLKRVLNKFTALREFGSSPNLKKSQIRKYLQLVIEKKVKSTSAEILNNFKAKFILFLLNYTKLIKAENCMLKIFLQYSSDFIDSRNPALAMNVWSNLFQTKYPLIWIVGEHISKHGLQSNIRKFRRIQTLILLNILYQNIKSVNEDFKLADMYSIAIQKFIKEYVKMLTTLNDLSITEFKTLLTTLISMNNLCISKKLTNIMDMKKICSRIQKIRLKLGSLDNMSIYAKFCHRFGLPVVKNTNLNVSPKINGTFETESLNVNNKEEQNDVKSVNPSSQNFKGNKRKANNFNNLISKRKKSVIESIVKKE